MAAECLQSARGAQIHGERHIVELLACFGSCACVLLCFFVLNLRSCCGLWFSSVWCVCVCACLCVRCSCVCVCLGTVQFLHLSLQPARPTLYAMSDFNRPFRAVVTSPHAERHTVAPRGAAHCRVVCLLCCLCLCASVFVLNHEEIAESSPSTSLESMFPPLFRSLLRPR